MSLPTPTSSHPATTSNPLQTGSVIGAVASNVAATLPFASYVSTALRAKSSITAEWIGELWLSAVNYWLVELALGKSRQYLDQLNDPLFECVFETLDNDSRSAVPTDLQGSQSQPPPSHSTRKVTKVYGPKTKGQASLHPSPQELSLPSEQLISFVPIGNLSSVSSC
ncbi:BZ3500_MvSof-1268-A1-R1_Chr3-3g06516 [Microbotryum saponariae]|uniref:BZ3500_MvSof-1268-A1-R1_Chr3-3g06516 protein n=1 Tax=Microbotryum saponariae TaxID=289078 RepID=A0A2X0LYE7_9BASI|nr:BZ3500_MvSof-1268-A1-R1_Chr3-3g06516 [Microbotryum saponariae]SDA04483.1 BZ3501_MvSof-1269-A2-R1_Chr3-2g06203 [Microbotryum saponariae]